MAYSRVLDTVEKIETEKLADRVVVHARDGRIIYKNALQPDGQWQHPPAARQAILAERGRSLTPAEWNEHIKRFDDIEANQHRPDRHASVDEIDEVRQLHRSAVREGGLTAQVGMHPHLSRAMPSQNWKVSWVLINDYLNFLTNEATVAEGGRA